MPTEDAYSSGHLILSHAGTCKCSNVETNLSWTCLVSGLLSFEHPSVLLFSLLKESLVYTLSRTSSQGKGWIVLRCYNPCLNVKNFPGWPTLFHLCWGRPIKEDAYTVTYILTSWMIKICMLSTILTSTESVAEWLSRLTFDLGIVSSSPARDIFFSVCNLA